VVVEHDTDGDERAQLSRLVLDTLPEAPVTLDGLEPLVRDPSHIHTLVDVRPDGVVYATNRRNDVDFDVMARGLAGREERVLYAAGGYVYETTVAPDSDTVAVTLLSLQPGSTQVRLVSDGAVTDVTPARPPALHHHVRPLPGGALVMSSNSGREFTAVARVDRDGTWAWLVEADDHDVVVWPSPDGQHLLVGHHIDGATSLALHDADGAHRYDVPLPGQGVVEAGWSAGSRWVVLALSSPTIPGDLLALDVSSGDVRRVVSAGDEAPQGLIQRLVEPTSHRVPARDGERVPCFVYAPHDGDGSVVIHIHGGPEAQAERQWSPVVQALVAAGHTVLVPNVRGSTGYGKRWYSLDDVRLRLESVADLADLRAWTASLGCDPERVALYGGSYGGYMVLAGLTMQPDLWAAGVDVVGISSLVTFLENTSAYRRAVREREYGSLERDRDFLVQASPLTYLGQITRPLFVIHGANDPRVPLSESEQIKSALDAKGVPCTLLVYSDEGHGLARRDNRLDAYPRALAFLAEHLQSPRRRTHRG
jgi:dipeptidyl aminopeptidase/acylaminoacyl peptidase